ncbi:HAMP domain-containing histidine kinase [Demequina sediminicola]|uniref:HAMP domain-containing histidine kinase n=1 Tax=Demequina sediminicola TaxID=1095026 RepID=UPI000782F78F|nr:HAMP domain-containing histidine kinase [Demequina sediminicola]
MNRISTITPADLLPVSGKPARALLVLFAVTNLAFAWGTLDDVQRPWQAFVAVVIISGAGFWVTRSRPYPFPLADSFVTLALLGAGALAAFTNLDGPADASRASWHIGSVTWVLFLLAVRGRIGYAWLGMALLIVHTMGWEIRTGDTALAALGTLDTHIGILVVGTLFALALRRSGRDIAQVNARAMDVATSTAITGAAAEIRRTRVKELTAFVMPLLDRVASPEPLTEDERGVISRAEAQLRDGVRGRAVALPDVVEATDKARARGVHIALLDDRGTPISDGHVLERIVTSAVNVIDAAQGGTVTIRLLPPGRTAVLTITAVDGDNVTRVSLDAQGEPLDR